MEINSSPGEIEWVEIYKKIIAGKLNRRQQSSGNEGNSWHAEKEANKWNFRNLRTITSIGSNKTRVHRQSGHHETFYFRHWNEDKPVVFLLFDNLRFDQWKVIEPIITELYRVESEDYFFQHPAHQHSNTAGMPYLQDNAPGHRKNIRIGGLMTMKKGVKFERRRIVGRTGQAMGAQEMKVDYTKVDQYHQPKTLTDNVCSTTPKIIWQPSFTILLMLLSHSRTEMEVIKELASDEKHIGHWQNRGFEFPALGCIAKPWKKDIVLFITTDHGTIRRVNNPVKKETKILPLILGTRWVKIQITTAKKFWKSRICTRWVLPKTQCKFNFLFLQGKQFLSFTPTTTIISTILQRHLSTWRHIYGRNHLSLVKLYPKNRKSCNLFLTTLWI